MGESEFWWWSVVDSKVPNKGYYTVAHIGSGSNKENFNLIRTYNIIFIEADFIEGYSFLVHLCEVNKPEELTLGAANYDEESKCLHIELDDEVGFPHVLQLIDTKSPTNREDKVWKNIIDSFEDKSYDSISQQIINSLGNLTFLDNELEVDDVLIGRKNLFVYIKHLLLPDQPIKCYSLELAKYPFLKCIHPSGDASIIRKDEDNELYIFWPEEDLLVVLKDFESKEEEKNII